MSEEKTGFEKALETEMAAHWKLNEDKYSFDSLFQYAAKWGHGWASDKGVGYLNDWMESVSKKRVEKLETIISGLSGYISASEEFKDKHPQAVEDWIYASF